MPKRTDIKKILIPGSGPIVIGQACEFDYSGTQAVRALRGEGYEITLVNSNPATVMTDPELADSTYIEPLLPKYLEAIIKKERPDAILPTMGGQTALNVALALDESGVLEKYNVEMIGASSKAINTAENRQLFNEAMADIGLETPVSKVVKSLDEAMSALTDIGLPCIIRPSFTLGGSGGGVAHTEAAFIRIVKDGLALSPTTQVQMDKSLLGWKEFELEVVRDSADNCIIVCGIENLDPMGIHTGDSITVAPIQTLTDREYQQMRSSAISILRRIGVDTGGSNVQFAMCPKTGRQIVIEMNPRVSRSSALASKATGFPIAKIAALLAVGYTLDELRNEVTGGVTPASFEPAIDYVVTKIPRFDFEKFGDTSRNLTTKMQAIGEVMAIGSTFQESFQKAIRSLEKGWFGLVTPDSFMTEELSAEELLNGEESASTKIVYADVEAERQAMLKRISDHDDQNFLCLAEAFRLGSSLQEIADASGVDPWFLAQIEDLVREEAVLIKEGKSSLTPTRLHALKRKGFSDARLAELVDIEESDLRERRHKNNIRPVYRLVDSCAAEFESTTSYLYSTYESANQAQTLSKRDSVIVLGSGPNRIGQGIEFDYCCVHAAAALREANKETIMLNCNPETVSTDYDQSDKLYFEPITVEDVVEVAEQESVQGVMVQFGGQTPLSISRQLENAGIQILGTPPAVIHRTEEREEFRRIVQRLGLKQPSNDIAFNLKESVRIAHKIGYPLVVRPSYVLGGRAMEIVYNDSELVHYVGEAIKISQGNPILLDSFLEEAVEVDVEAVCDGHRTLVMAVTEHVEQAGIHSGDSACSLPAWYLSEEVIKKITEQTERLGLELGVRGLMNIQFAITKEASGDEIYLLEVNPRASRTVPFVAKVIGIPLPRVAVDCALGISLDEQQLMHTPKPKMKVVKEAVFPFNKFDSVDPYLGPEMRSTGEVMGVGATHAEAYLKSQLSALQNLPTRDLDRGAFISLRDSDKPQAVKLAQNLSALDFKLWGTRGTAKIIKEAGIAIDTVNKVSEGTPHCLNLLQSGKCQVVVNTSEGSVAINDSASIRLTAQALNIYTTTSIRGALRFCEALPILDEEPQIYSLQDIYKNGQGV